jgi:RimJ/RimL family protein N-acetyltransferase
MADVDAIVADFERIDYDSEAECLADELHLPRSPQGCRLHWEQIAKGGPPSDNCSLVIIDHSENLCGFIGVHDTSPRHGGFCYGMSILPEFRGLGYAKEAVTMVLDYYFNHLRYHRCGTHIYDFNPRSIRFHEKMGFVKCGQLHGCHFFEGKYHDSFLYEMISEHFNTINDR